MTSPQTATADAPTLVVEGVGKRFGDRQAVRDVSFQVARGELLAIIGPNGAGKTTTLRMLAGLLAPSAGEVEILGESILGVAGTHGVHRSVGYMPDFFGVYEDMLAWEYLDFFARCHDLSPERRDEAVTQLLDLVDLSAKRDAQVDTLSRGMKQRLCLAQSLVHDPAVLLLDEPASGLDPRARLEMRELLRELSAMGKTIIISSHILSELAEVCDGIAVMERGELLDHGSVEDLQRRRRPRGLWELTVVSDRAQAVAVLGSIEEVDVVEEAVVDAAVEQLGASTEDGAADSGGGLLPLPVADDAPESEEAHATDDLLAAPAAHATVVLALDGDATQRAAMVAALVGAGVAVAGLRPLESGLEDLFMEITRGGTDA